MNGLKVAAVAALLAASGGIVRADPVDLTKSSPQNTYFNRPGADMATHDAELRECLTMAHRTSQPQTGGYAGGSFLAAIVAAAVEGALDVDANNHSIRANAENCMVVRGWRVVEIPADEADAIAKLPQADQAAKLKDWVGAANPHGDIIRQWGNDAAIPATLKFERGQLLGKPDLSFSARDRSQDVKQPDAETTSIWHMMDGAANPLKPSELAAKVPAGDAILLVQVKNSGFHPGDTLVFRRIGPDDDTPARKADKQPDMLWAYDNYVWHKAGQWIAVAAPPGRWRLEKLALQGIGFEVNFCLGAPAFDVKAGDVIYAGTFDLNGEGVTPDLALDPARAWLGAGSPYAAQIKPAAYVNGSRAKCSGSSIYDLEFKGAPYADGYGWGGARVANAAATSTPPSVIEQTAHPTASSAPTAAPAPASAPSPAPSTATN